MDSDDREAIVQLPKVTHPCGHPKFGPSSNAEMTETRLCAIEEWAWGFDPVAKDRLLAIARAALRIGPNPICETHDPDCGCCACEMRRTLRGVVA